jgi:hypothetical protein
MVPSQYDYGECRYLEPPPIRPMPVRGRVQSTATGCDAGPYLNLSPQVALKPMRNLIAIVFMIRASASAAECEKYKVLTTRLSGAIHIETFFGPPNYGESPETDSKEQQAILRLIKPLCTVASEDDSAERDQVEVTLAPMGEINLQAFVGKRVMVSGSLFHGFTAHHHTPVLIAISQAPKALDRTPVP